MDPWGFPQFKIYSSGRLFSRLTIWIRFLNEIQTISQFLVKNQHISVSSKESDD